MVQLIDFPSIDHPKYIDLTLFNQIAPLLNSSEGSFVVHKQVSGSITHFTKNTPQKRKDYKELATLAS
jgi:hypothetical protein